MSSVAVNSVLSKDFEASFPNLTSSQQLLLLVLAYRANDDLECWPCTKEIIRNTKLDRKSVFKVKKELIILNILIDTGKRIGRSKQITVYKVNILTSSKTDTSTKCGTGTSPKFGTSTSPKFGTWKDHSEKQIKNTLILSPKKEEPVHFSNTDESVLKKDFFEEVYAQYSHRRNMTGDSRSEDKRLAKQTWIAYNLDEDVEAIREGIRERELKDKKYQSGFAVNFSIFLKNKIYNEPVSVSNQTIQVKNYTGAFMNEPTPPDWRKDEVENFNYFVNQIHQGKRPGIEFNAIVLQLKAKLEAIIKFPQHELKNYAQFSLTQLNDAFEAFQYVPEKPDKIVATQIDESKALLRDKLGTLMDGSGHRPIYTPCARKGPSCTGKIEDLAFDKAFSRLMARCQAISASPVERASSEG